MYTRKASTKAKLLLTLMALFTLYLPTIAQIDNCCGIDRQCSTNDEWVSGYYAFQNNQCAAPAEQQQGQQARQQRSLLAINNCCFTGWHCDTDEEWTSGYWAFQNNHCASQSHWEEQMRKRQNSNQPQRRNNNQPRQNSDSSPQGSSGSRNWEEESIVVTDETITIGIDPTNEEEREYETEGGLTISLQPLTRERLCEFASYLSICK